MLACVNKTLLTKTSLLNVTPDHELGERGVYGLIAHPDRQYQSIWCIIG